MLSGNDGWLPSFSIVVVLSACILPGRWHVVRWNGQQGLEGWLAGGVDPQSRRGGEVCGFSLVGCDLGLVNCVRDPGTGRLGCPSSADEGVPPTQHGCWLATCQCGQYVEINKRWLPAHPFGIDIASKNASPIDSVSLFERKHPACEEGAKASFHSHRLSSRAPDSTVRTSVNLFFTSIHIHFLSPTWRTARLGLRAASLAA